MISIRVREGIAAEPTRMRSATEQPEDLQRIARPFRLAIHSIQKAKAKGEKGPAK
jgi:hypothetical protein